MPLGRKMREALFYTVEKAGRMKPLKLSRSESYRWAKTGAIPTIRDGRFQLVPKPEWDAEIKRRLEQIRDAELQSRRLKSAKPEPKPARRAVTHKSENSEFA